MASQQQSGDSEAQEPGGVIRPNLRPIDGGNGGGDNGNGGPHHPPPINFPEIGFQFSDCLDKYDDLVPPQNGGNKRQKARPFFQDLFRQAVAQRLGGNPQVDSGCGQGGEIGGIWLASQVDERALNYVHVLPAGEAYAFEFFATALQARIAKGWEDVKKAYGGEIRDKQGNVILTFEGYEFSLMPPNQLVFKFHSTAHPGFPVPDSPLTVTFTTTLSLVKGKVQVYTIPEVSVNTDLEIALIWPVIVGGALGGFPAAAELGWVLQDLVNDKVEEGKWMKASTIGGLARDIRQQLLAAFPDHYLIPGARTEFYQPHKLEFLYDKSPKVDPNGGILVTSNQSFPNLYTLRQPAVSLGGDKTIPWTRFKAPGMSGLVSDDQGAPGFIPYRFGANFLDLREPLDSAHITEADKPLQVSWSVSGQLNGKLLPPATNPLDHSRMILFGPIINPDAVQDGDTATVSVTIQVTDDDGLTASDQVQVTFVYVASPPPPPPPPPEPLPEPQQP
jgi:hypothetical protein